MRWNHPVGSTKYYDFYEDVTIQELTHIACMDILAENQDMHLSEQEKKQAARAAKEYYQSLTEEEKTFIGLYEREIRTAYEEYALAEKLYHALTQGTDEDVSDDEARVVRVQQIYVKEKEALRAVQENLAAGDDFASVASNGKWEGRCAVEKSNTRNRFRYC